VTDGWHQLFGSKISQHALFISTASLQKLMHLSLKISIETSQTMMQEHTYKKAVKDMMG